MLAANGVISEPLIHGVVYCNNNAVYGYTTVAPIVNVVNKSSNEIVLRYASRQDNLALSLSAFGNANTVRVASGGQALLVDLIPGSLGSPGGIVTFITVEQSGQQGFDLYALVFTTARGYYLVRAPDHFEMDSSGAISVSETLPNTAVAPTTPVFPLEFCGCQKPKWPWALVYTAAFFPRPADPREDRGPDCAALTTWATEPLP